MRARASLSLTGRAAGGEEERAPFVGRENSLVAMSSAAWRKGSPVFGENEAKMQREAHGKSG